MNSKKLFQDGPSDPAAAKRFEAQRLAIAAKHNQEQEAANRALRTKVYKANDAIGPHPNRKGKK